MTGLILGSFPRDQLLLQIQRGLRHDLQKGIGPDRESSNERPIISADEQETGGCPVANSPMATSAAARLSPWERTIAIKTQMASIVTQAHFTKLTDEWLTRMRWRRASRADSSATAISRCAIPWPWLLGVRASVSCNASTRLRGAISNVAV